MSAGLASPAVWSGVAALIGRYRVAVDEGTTGAVAALFVEPDGELIVHGGASFRGREEIVEFLTGSRRSRAGSFSLRHHVSGIDVDPIGLGKATASCYFLAMTQRGIDHWGVYRDRVRLVGDEWAFEQRIVTIEGADPAGWIGSGSATVGIGSIPGAHSQEFETLG